MTTGYDPMKIVELRNGGEGPMSIITAIVTSLVSMMEGDMLAKLAFIEFVRFCQAGKNNPGVKKISQKSVAILDRLKLIEVIDEKVRVPDLVSDTVLSAVEGQGFAFRIVSPYAD